jgi:hypothetical protein
MRKSKGRTAIFDLAVRVLLTSGLIIPISQFTGNSILSFQTHNLRFRQMS